MQVGEVLREARGADVLEHADAADRVERAVLDIAVVLDADVDALVDIRVDHALGRELGLLPREGDADRVNAMVAGGVERHRTPAAADVEQPHAGAQGELAAHQLVLVRLRLLERLVGLREDRA